MSTAENNVSLTYKKSITTAVVLGNAVELTKELMRAVVGNEIADTLNKEPLTDSIYGALAVSGIRSALAPKTGV